MCVNTPPACTLADNKLLGKPTDMRAFKSVIKSIAESSKVIIQNKGFDKPKILVVKSTVPVGTSKMTEELLYRVLSVSVSSQVDVRNLFTIVSMPEFLAEGQAIQNLVQPDRIVIGVPKSDEGARSFQLLNSLYDEKTTLILPT